VAATPGIGAVFWGPDRRNVDEFDARRLSQGIEGTELDVVGFQDGGSDVGNRALVVAIKGGSAVWRGGV